MRRSAAEITVMFFKKAPAGQMPAGAFLYQNRNIFVHTGTQKRKPKGLREQKGERRK